MPSKDILSVGVKAKFFKLREALKDLGEASRVATEAMNIAPTTSRVTVRYDRENNRVVFQDESEEGVETSARDFLNELEAPGAIVSERIAIEPQNDFMISRWSPVMSSSEWEMVAGERKKAPEINITVSEKLNLIGE